MPTQQKRQKPQWGQGLTEYLLLVGIIAIGSLWVVSKLGESIRTATGNMVNVLTNQKAETRREITPVRKHHMGRLHLWQSIRKEPKSRGQ